jgi:hypothetical protein
MQCEHAQEFISEYVTGEMDRALVVTLENHLSACAACTETVHGLRRLWATLDQLPVVEPPASFHVTLMERISDEQRREAREAKAPVRVSAWRGVFQPRVFAYAAAALVLLLSAELVQVQRASLGPLGLVLNILHPAPLLRTQKVEWTPTGQGGGTLRILLQSHAQINGAVSQIHVHLQLTGKAPTIAPSIRQATFDGEITSDKVTVVEIPLTYTPSDEAEVVRLKLTPVDGGTEQSQTIAIPVSPTQ